MESTRRLRYLCALRGTGSVHGAADACGISAPAMSRAIKALERDVGRPLVVRAGRGIALTDEAHTLAEAAQPLLEQLEAIVEGAGRDDAAIERRFALGTFEYCSTWLLPELLGGDLCATGVQLVELGPGELERALGDGVVDAIVTHAPAPVPGLEFERAGTLAMDIFGRAGQFDDVHRRDLPFVAPSMVARGTAAGIRSLDGWPLPEHERTVRHQVGLLESALALCRAGAAVAWLPARLVAAHDAIVASRYRLAPVDYAGPRIRASPQHLHVGWRRGADDPRTWQLLARLRRIVVEST